MIDKTPKNGKLRAFLKGFASAFDITGGVEMPDPATGWERDGAAIRGDWQWVGDDLRRAMGQYPVSEKESEHRKVHKGPGPDIRPGNFHPFASIAPAIIAITGLASIFGS
jgi:hypothetical protein